ncbi:MAG: ComEC family competence protein [Acetobacter sp.]|nr:ComEC family competence protein [Acetobacter sp.]
MRWWVKKQLLRLKLYAAENYMNEAESLIIWYAVCFALGAAFYFALPLEPSVWLITILLEAVLILLYLTRRHRAQFKTWTYILLFILGVSIAKADAMYRALNLENKMPEITYLRGKVKELDYNSNNRPRILLTNAENFEHPLKGDFRISLFYAPTWLKPDTCVELVAKLPKRYTPNPLSNYNYERANFYKGISAGGYSIAPVYEVDCEKQTPYALSTINKIRTYIKEVVEKNSKPEQSAIIKALTIGDKSSIAETQTENYRTAGLAHFLAISGMHMGMIALLVFFLLRAILFPVGAGRYDLRKPAAIASLCFTLIYFLISGQSVSCIRAFVMTSLVLLGVLMNRRAISLRLWAFAILVVTVITPAAVVSPGFLMSFAAVLGLVSFYERYGNRLHHWLSAQSIYGKMGTYFAGVVITDLVASLMTLPYSMYYFHQISVYTSLGNLLAAPVIAFWVMPMLLIFLISLPLGLGIYTIKPLAAGIDIINYITTWIASLPAAKSGEGVGSMPDWGIFILTLGLLWLCIWQSRWRLWGWLGIAIGLVGLYFAPTPDFVFDESGETFAYKNITGKFALSPYHKNRFLSKMWTGGTKPATPDETINCTNKSCIYKNDIEFSRGLLKLNGKDVELKSGGYITLPASVHHHHPERTRLWNRS